MNDHPEGGQPHTDIHRRIAAALAELVPDDPGVAPHPYLRRHLAKHAARGHVLDDTHVPPALLPWESSQNVGRLLATDDGNPEDSRWLRTWAGLEPFAQTADPLSRMTSLQLAHRSTGSADSMSAQPSAFGDTPVTLEWSDKSALPRAWHVTRHVVRAMTAVEDFRGRHTRIAAGDDRGTLHVLNRDGTNACAPLAVHDGIIEHLLALPGGIVVSGGTDGAVHVTDVRQGRHLAVAVPRRCGSWVSSLALYRPRDHPPVMVTAFSDGHLVALNIGTFHAADIPLPENLSTAPMLAALPTPAGPDLLLYTQRDEVLSFDGTQSSRRLRTPAGIRALVALPTSSSFAVGDEAGNLLLGSAVTDDTAAHRSHETAITALLATQVGQREALVAADAHGTVQLLELPDLRPMGKALPAHSESATALSLLTVRNRTRLLTAGADCTLRSVPLTEDAFATAPSAQEHISASALSPTVPHLLATAQARRITVRDIATRRPARTALEDVNVTALAWPYIDGTQHLAVALDDNRILVIDPEAPHDGPRHELNGHYQPVRALVPLSDAHRDMLASAGPDAQVRLWDLRTGEQLAAFPDHRFTVQCLATTRTRDGLLLASGGSDGNVRVWDTHAFEQRGPTIRCKQYIVNDLAFVTASDGALAIASAGQDGSLKLWDAHSGSQVGCFDAEDGELSAVTALALPSGRRMLIAAGRSSIHIWETARGDRKLLQIVTGKPVRALRTVTDGRTDRSSLLLATGEDGTSVFRLHFDRI
ncbi:WD40 repeat domain-containing protein [Streptomyces sp. NPDC097704]|uniref:WD40 repeat domain-containing protein n=1 Tax=Streptomyces sp. NPDC097704 TaxID=3157101 RepID=UPI0033247E53